MSAWGNAWGDAWGDAWGAVGAPAEAPTAITGPDDPREKTDFTDDDLLHVALALIVSGALE